MINSDTGHATLLHSFQGEEEIEWKSMIVFDDNVVVALDKYLYTFKVTTDC